MNWIRTAKVLGVVAILAATFWAGREWRDRSADLEIAELKASHRAQEESWESDMQDAAIAAAQTSIALEQEKSREAKVVTKEVVRYVQNPDIPRVQLPSEWVLLHDKAWRNAATPGTAEPFTDGSAPVTDADAVAVTAHNAEACGQALSRLRGIRLFYEEVRAAANE